MNTIEVTTPSFAGSDGYITDAETFAQTATLFTPGSEVAVSLERTDDGRWIFAFSDYLNPDDEARELTWTDASDAFADLAAACGVTFSAVEL
jgi:hypothetical protein